MTLFNTHTHNLLSEELGIKQLTTHSPLPEFYFSVGIHPMHVKKSQFIPENPLFFEEKCLAIGEIGLDNRFEDSNLQEEIYIKQLELASKLNKPIILHSVNTIDRCLFLHQKYANNCSLVFHGFNKVNRISDLLKIQNLVFSFGASILLNEQLSNKLKQIPIERILLETDNSSEDLNQIYERVAEIKSVNLPDFTEQLFQNAQRIFKTNF